VLPLLSAQRLRRSKDSEGANKEYTKKKELKKLLQSRTSAQLRVLLVKLDNYVSLLLSRASSMRIAMCCIFVWDCMRKMKTLEEPGYSAPLLD